MSMSLLADDEDPRASGSQEGDRNGPSRRPHGRRWSKPAKPGVTPLRLLAEEGRQEPWYAASARASGEPYWPDGPGADAQHFTGGQAREESEYDWEDAYDGERARERYYGGLPDPRLPPDGQRPRGQSPRGQRLPGEPTPDAFLRDEPSRDRDAPRDRDALRDRDAPPDDRNAPPRPLGRRDGDRRRLQQYVSTPQRLGGLLLALVSLVGAAIYVPMILSADRHSLTGVVSDSGVAILNFAASGRVRKIGVHVGQVVQGGRVLATEAAAARAAAVRATSAAIAADKANLTALLEASGGGQTADVAAAEAKLASDGARRSAARMDLAETRIVAPRRGTVVAIYGQAGETAGPAGIRNLGVRARQQPRFSLFPSGPMPSVKAGPSGLLPVIALRTSGGWQVKVLIPQSSALSVTAGEDAVISVPAAGLRGVRGVVADLSPAPVTTSGGVSYQAVIRVIGRHPVAPLSGMTANVRLGSHSGGG